MKKFEPLNMKAVITGFLSDLGSTYLFMISMLIVLYNPGSSKVCLADQITDPLPLDLFCMLCGIALTGVGGFIAGRLAGRDVIRHGMAVGCFSLIASLLMCNFDLSPLSLLGYSLTIPMAAFGGMVSSFFPPTERD